jgi:hypothetical protein
MSVHASEASEVGTAMRMRRPSTVVVLALVAAATAGRLAYAYWVHAPGQSVYTDMAVYHRQALHLLAGVLSPEDTLFPMGYPALVAAAYAVSERGLRVMTGIQALAGGLTCLLAYLVARRFYLSEGWALAALVAVALYPPFIHYGSLLLTEAVSPLFFTLTIWLMLEALDRPTWWRVVALGVSFAVAVVIRPNLLPVAPVIAVCVWVGLGRQVRPSLRFLTVFSLAALPLLVIVSVTNSTLTRRFSGLSTNGGLNFFMMQAEVARVQFFDRGIGPVRNVIKYHGVFNSPVPLYEEPYFYREGLRLIRESPGRALVRAGDNLREATGLGAQAFWPLANASSDRDWKHARLYPAGTLVLRWCSRGFLFVLVLPPLAVILTLTARRVLFQPDQVAWIAVAGSLVTMLVTSLVFLADPRMHVPFDALLMVASLAAAKRATIGI